MFFFTTAMLAMKAPWGRRGIAASEAMWRGGPTEKEARGGCESRQDGVGGVGARSLDACLSGGSGQQQDDAASPARVRDALRQGIELHKSRDYEKAAPFFDFAKTGEKSLTAPELKDLAAFSARTPSP